MYKNIVKLFGLACVSFALGCGGNVDVSENSLGGTPSNGDDGGSNAAGASGQAGQGGQAGSSGSSGNAGSAGVSGQAGSSGSSGSGGSAGAAGSSGQAGSSGASGTGGTSPDGGSDGEAGSAGSDNDAGTDAADAQTAPVLEVSLSPSTPAGMTMCDGSQATVFKFDLANESTSDITLDKLRLHRVGVGSSSDISVGGLSGNYISLGIPDNTGYLTFDNMQFKIPAKAIVTLSYWIQANTTQPASQIAIELADAGAVTLAGNAKVQGSFPVRGNTFTLSAAKCGSLSAELTQPPVSGTVVKKSQNQEVLGIKFTAGINDVMLTLLPLKCQASLNGAPYSGADCMKRVTSLALYDGNTQVGTAFAPNADGTATFSPNWLIPNGMTKTLTVKASFASTASQTMPYDKISIGIADGAAAEDMVYGQYVAVTVGTNLANQLSQNPAVTTTILPSGTLKIEPDAQPASRIVIAGKDVWVQFAGYKATAQYEAASMDMLIAFFCTSVINGCDADNRDFTEVAVATGGVVHGTTLPPDGNNWWVRDVSMFSDPLIVPKDDSIHFELWGKLAPIVPFGVAAGPDGAARSGHTPALGLIGGYHSQDWDAAYTDKVNVRTTGQTSGERLYADIAGTDLLGKKMTIRESQPIITKLQLANTVLMNVDMETLRIQVAADSAGPIAFRQLPIWMEKTASLDLANFRLFRSSSPVDPSLYDLRIENVDAHNIFLTFVWKDGLEEVITGSGNVYSLRTTVMGATQGSYLLTSLVQSGPGVRTGYLLSDAKGLLMLCSQPDDSPTNCPFAGLAWSEYSALVHSPFAGPNGSGDFTWGFQVQDMVISQLLAYN